MPTFLAELPSWPEVEEELKKRQADAATIATVRTKYWQDYASTEEIKAQPPIQVEATRSRFFQQPITPTEPNLTFMEKAAALISPPGPPPVAPVAALPPAAPVVAPSPEVPAAVPPPEVPPLLVAHQPPLPGPMNVAETVVAPGTGRTLAQMEGRPVLLPSHAPVRPETTIGPTTGPLPPILPPVERRSPAPQGLGEQFDALVKGFGVGYEKGAADYQNELRDLTVGLAHRAGIIKKEPPRAETPDISGVPAGIAGSTGMTLGSLPATLLSIFETAGIGRAEKAGRAAAKLIPRIVRSATDFAARFGGKTAVQTIGAGGTPKEAAKRGGISAAGAAVFGAAGPIAAETAATAGRTVGKKLVESGVAVETAALVASAVERVVHGTIAATPIYPMAKAQGASDEQAVTETLAWILFGAHKSGAGEWAAKRTDAVNRGATVFERGGIPPAEAKTSAETIVDLAHSGDTRGAEAALRAVSREAAKTLQELPERPGLAPEAPQQPPAAPPAAPVPNVGARPVTIPVVFGKSGMSARQEIVPSEWWAGSTENGLTTLHKTDGSGRIDVRFADQNPENTPNLVPSMLRDHLAPKPPAPPAAKAAARPIPQPEMFPGTHDATPDITRPGFVPGDETGIGPPPGQRWETDPGAMPGEPYFRLDIPKDGETGDGKAFITEREIEGKGAVWEAWLSDGRGGQFTNVEDAAKWAEEQTNASAIRAYQGQRVPEAAQEGSQAQVGAQEGQGDRGTDLEQAPPREPEPVVEGGKGPVQEVVKQPWEMNREEWNAATRFYRSGKTKNAQLPTGQRVILTGEATASNFLEQSGPFLETLRRQAVEAAVRQGKPVPPEVLAELGLAPTPVDQAMQRVVEGAGPAAPAKTTPATEPPPEHVVRALQTPPRSPSDSVITETKEQAKATLREAIADGTVTRDTPVRLTDTRELNDLVARGGLTEEKSAQIVVGDKGEALPIMGYGHGISAAVIMPEGYSRKAVGLEHAQPNEVKIDPKAPVSEMRFVVDGYKRLLTYAELVELIDTGKLAALEQAAALRGEKPEVILKGGEALPGEPATGPGPEVSAPQGTGGESGGVHPAAGELGVPGRGPAVGAEKPVAPAHPPVPPVVAEVAPAPQSYTIEPASHAKNAIIVRVQSGTEGMKGPLHGIVEGFKGRYVNREHGYILPKNKEAKVREALDAAIVPVEKVGTSQEVPPIPSTPEVPTVLPVVPEASAPALESETVTADLAEQKRVEKLNRPLPEGVREFSYKLTKAERQVLDEVDLGEAQPSAFRYGTRGHAQQVKALARMGSRGLVAPDTWFLTPRGEDVARAIQQERMGLPYDQRPGVNWVPPDPLAVVRGFEGISGKAVGGLFADKNGDPWITDGHFLVRAKPGTKVAEGPAPTIEPIINVTKADLDPVSGPVAWYRTQVRDNVILSNGLIVNADLLAAVLGKEGGDLYTRKADADQPLRKNGGVYVLRGDQVHGVIMPIVVDEARDLPENYRWMWEDGKIHERDLTRAPKAETTPLPTPGPTEGGGTQEPLPFEGVGTEPLLRKAAPPAERIPVAPLPGGTEGETGQLIPTLAKSLARRIRVAKMKRGRLGQYEPSSTATSIRYQGDLATTAHEIGHDLDDAYGITPLFSSGNYDSELKPFWNLGTKIPASKPNAIVLRRQEGWAEFLRAMIGNPDEARAQAPRLAAVYDERLPSQVRAILGHYSGGVRRFAGLSPEEMVRSNIEMEAASRTQRLRQDLAGTGYEFNTMGWADKLGSKIIDDLGRVMKGIRTAEELRGIDRLLPQDDPAILIRNWFGWTEERFVDILANGVPIHNSLKRATGPFADLFEPLDASTKEKLQADYRDVVALLPAERVGERAGHIDAEVQAKIDQWDEAVADGRMKAERRDAAVARLKKIAEARKGRLAGWGHGIYSDTEVAASAVENLKRDPERFARLQKAADLYRKWCDAALRYNVDSGRMSEEFYQQVKARNQQYADMHRVASEIDPNYQSGGRAGGRKLGTPTETVQKFTGSTKKLGNPYINLMMQTAAILREADRNAAVRAFTDILTAPRKMGEGTPIPLEQIGRRVKEGTKDAIIDYADGKPRSWQFEEGLHAELKALGKLPMAPAVLRLPASILRWAVVHSPPFQIRNAIRDAFERFRVSDVGSLPWDTLKGYTKEQLSDYLRAGGATGWYFHDRTRYALKLKETLEDLAKDETTILASWHSIKRGAERFYRGSELVGRMAEYRKAFAHAKEKLGYSDYNASLFAANKARGLLDFNTAGSWTRWVNQIRPFTSPQIRGLMRNLEAMEKHPVRGATGYVGGFLGAWVASILIPKLIEYLWNSTGDDAEEYRQLPDYQRDLFFNLKIAPNLWLRIPLGFETAVWGGSVTRAIDYARGNKNAFEGHIGQLMRATLPLDESALAGPFTGIVQLLANYDFFRGQHIIPVWEEGKDVRLRDTSRASRLGQAVQQVLGVDARQVDFLMTDTMGDLGRYVQEASNVGRAEKRPHTTADILRQVGAVFTASPAGQARDVQATFDAAQRAGMEQDAQVKHLRDLLKWAYESPTDKERDTLLKRMREYATRIRPLIERRAEQAIQTKGQKMQRKMYGAEGEE